jgi:hypothetical protein
MRMNRRDPEREQQGSEPANLAVHDPVREQYARALVFVFLAILAVLLTGCGEDTSGDALERYSILMDTDTTTPAERCKASGEVADAFLHEGNREAYQRWHAIHTIQCMDDGPMVIG